MREREGSGADRAPRIGTPRGISCAFVLQCVSHRDTKSYMTKHHDDWSRGCGGVRGRHRHRRGRKERVLHTRVSDRLADDIRRIAEDLRVPASNLVRNVLEEVFDVVETVSDDVGELFEEMLDEAEDARGRIARARGRADHRRRRGRGPRDEGAASDRAAWSAAEAEVEDAEQAGVATPPPPPVDWHYVEGGETRGPVGREVLARAARQGRLRGDTLVWTTGMGDWKPAARVRALEGIFAPPPPPAEPPPDDSPPPQGNEGNG